MYRPSWNKRTLNQMKPYMFFHQVKWKKIRNLRSFRLYQSFVVVIRGGLLSGQKAKKKTFGSWMWVIAFHAEGSTSPFFTVQNNWTIFLWQSQLFFLPLISKLKCKDGTWMASGYSQQTAEDSEFKNFLPIGFFVSDIEKGRMKGDWKWVLLHWDPDVVGRDFFSSSKEVASVEGEP